MLRVLLYYWKQRRKSPADVFDKTMDEDDRSFGVWDRVDASIELGVAVGYPLFSILCHSGSEKQGQYPASTIELNRT